MNSEITTRKQVQETNVITTMKSDINAPSTWNVKHQTTNENWKY